jgi:phosphatidylethanolamine/phosphatidyl-N-methylethanolamine N-methyltransferase
MRLHSSRVFLESAARDFKRTGAIAPSSRPLAHSMTSELAGHNRRPVKVLEVGGGTGSVTIEIARHLCRGDTLDVFEIDQNFAGLIRRRLHEESWIRERGIEVCVYDKSIETINLRSRYDFIISCLPFTNFQPQSVRKIFEIYETVLNPGGLLSFYEYILVRKAAGMVSPRPVRERFAGVSSVVREYLSKYCYKQQTVLRNLPPATVYHIRFNEV